MTDEFEEEQDSQPLVEHLTELRDRLLFAILSIIVVFLGLIYFANDIHTMVTQPFTDVLGDNSSLIVINPIDTFLTPLKMTFYASLFISMPILLYQIWAFIAPALYRAERKLAMPIFASSIILFYAGVAFAYFVVFPLVFGFLAKIVPLNTILSPDIAQLLNLIIKIFFAFGIAFEIPVATVILIVAGVMHPDKLVEKRPYVVVACFVFGMFLTPPDIFSQALLAIPMWALFEVGILFGRMAIANRKPENDDDVVDIEPEDEDPQHR